MLRRWIGSCLTPKFEIVIDDSLGFSIAMFSWLLPETHKIYKDDKRSVKNITASELTQAIEAREICCGVSEKALNANLINHVIPCKIDPLSDDLFPYSRQENQRVIECEILLKKEQCDSCAAFEKKLQWQRKSKERNLAIPAKPNAPISTTAPGKIKLTLQQHRLKCAQLEERIKEMDAELKASAVQVSDDLGKDLSELFE